MIEERSIEVLTDRIGRELLQRIEAARPKDYREKLEADPLMVWSRGGPRFLSDVLRFVDVFPAIRSDAELMEYLAAYVGDPKRILIGAGAQTDDLPKAVRTLVENLKARFVAGETIAEAVEQCRGLRHARFGFTLDLLGEAVTSEREAEQYRDAYLELIRAAAPAVADWPATPPAGKPERASADRCSHGRIPRLNLSIKLSSLYSRFDPIDPLGSAEGAAPRLRALLAAARAQGAAINVDMEQYALKDLTLEVFKKVLLEPEFRDWPDVSITIQTYLRENRADLAALAEWVEKRGAPINVRLVKGAYWDHEVQQAQYRNWPSPVYLTKEETDREFEAGIRFLLEHHEALRPAIASHNVRSAARAMAVAELLGLPRDCVEFQTLYGLGAELRRALIEMGFRMRVYRPFGALVPGMAYLVRRVLEVTSKAGFLQQMAASPLPAAGLLATPSPPEMPQGRIERVGLDAPFRNEPVSDFSRRDARDELSAAIERVRGELCRFYPLWIGDHTESAGEELISVNPSAKSEVVGRVACASRKDAAKAVRAAERAFPAWSRTPPRERAALLLRSAALMRRRRFELAAWEILEEAKSWREADADVAEAIDHLEYYAREMARLAAPRRRDVPGEDNECLYEPRGVAVAITPWNFPLAILTGATSAAAVAGNAVIMKPAEQSSVVAAKLMEIWNEAGAPPGVIQYLPGRGEIAGEFLVRHPRVQIIAFTGSLAVGLRIQRLAARVGPKQRDLKRVIAEMGGKNAIIVDRDADLDQAVPGVVVSAFGYQGQKCSACSRVIVHRAVYSVFLERLVEATRSLPIGPAQDPHAALGPLISDEAAGKVRKYMELARDSGRIAYQATTPETEGFYVGPMILAEVAPGSRLATEEVFGPLLCVMEAEDFDQAIGIANEPRYGLTGGLYSRNPDHLRRFKSECRAGNLYANRPITGALVDRQPFGGIGLSGAGSKAGGPDYLLQFMQPKNCTEYTVRRGFAPPRD
ncbi:MAG: proline dehydrogenase family protein [Candidatus Brocadiia bacterium]|jgi:RHH-type proline utilization regulon transcriptional repressor/proline dehydrogenase/delta 1-pyrroline-5-carboxylate dehydrogenase